MVVLLDLDDLPLDGTDRIHGGEHGGEIDRAEAEFLFVLEVDEADAAALFADEFGGVFIALVNPINIGLAAEIAGGGGVEHPVEDAAALDDGEFGGVVVEVKLQAEGAQAGADGAEFLADGGAGGGGGELVFGPAGADDVARGAGLGLGDDAVELVAQGTDADVHAGDMEAGGLDSGGAFGGGEVAEAGGFHTGITDGGDLRDGGGEIGFGEVAHGPELERGGRVRHKG